MVLARSTWRLLALAAVLLALAGPAAAQPDRYAAQYGDPVDVSLTDLALNPEQYERRAVRTKGTLGMPNQVGEQGFELNAGISSGVRIVPIYEISADFESEARKWVGRQIEVTGVVYLLSTERRLSGQTNVGIQFWSFVGPEEAQPKDAAARAKASTLEKLVTRPGSEDNQVVRVVGKFRGRNLYGDLPSKSQAQSGDWVIKDEEYAVWVTGKKPKGDGWSLDSDMKKDTGRWIEVVGRPATRGGITYIRAIEVRLTTAPSESAIVAPPPPPPPRPRVPPVVVFALPLDGEAEIPANTRFTVQFSKDMDVETFKGRVLLSYAPILPGDRPFVGMNVTYDGGLRALTIDPGDLLSGGRTVEIRLLPGIADVDGMELVPREKAPGEGVVDVLRWVVASS